MNNLKKTRANFTSIMRNFAAEKTSAKQDWFMINFCQLGFIGKLFRAKDLPTLIKVFLTFYSDKPVDWLLHDIISTKVCNPDCRKLFLQSLYSGKDAKPTNSCEEEMNKVRIQYKPSLFQHIGTHSSLNGKIQKSVDKSFGKTQSRANCLFEYFCQIQMTFLVFTIICTVRLFT